MKPLKILLVGAVALIAVAGCKKTDELVDTTPVYDDAYYASHASISSSDSNFTSNSTGGTIHFKVEGGEVKVLVSCGTDWLVQNDNPASFNAYASDSYYLTVSAEQNYVEEELTGTITLTTAEMHIAFASITVTQNAYGAPEITVSSNEWHVPAVGKLTTTITVDSDTEWTVEGGDEWLTVEKSGTGINLTAKENEDTEERDTKIVLTCTDGYKSDSETITVTQDGLAYITLSEEELSLPQFGDPVSVTVETNFDWEYSFNADWLTIDNDEKEGTLVITYDTNSTGKARDCVVTITSGDGASNVAEAELAVNQVAHSLTVETTEWHAPAIGELTKEIGVEAPADWSAETKVDWLTVEKTETGIILTANENVETTERNGEVVLSYTDELHFDSETITVTQDGLAYIELSDETLLLSKFESSTSVTVESNFDWDYSYDTTKDWLTIEKDVEDSSLKITYTENETGSDREVVVNITAGDGAENIAEVQLTITQSCENTDALILEYTITSSGTTTEIPIFNTETVTIDWDDGTTTTGKYGDSTPPSHTYSTPGIYDITVNGTVKMICSAYRGSKISDTGAITGVSYYLTAVKQWGNIGVTSIDFYKCSSLESLPEGVGPFSNVTSISFSNCTSLKELPAGIFDNCTTVRSISLSNCSSLEELPAGIFDNCTTVRSISLSNCSSLEELPTGIFDNCTTVTSISLYNCSSLKELPAGIFDNCTAITTFDSKFSGCSSLKTVPENMFSSCTAVTTFSDCFYNCTSLTSAPSFEGLSAVTTFESTFSGCSALTTVPEDIFSGCSAVTNFSDCFYHCTSLTTVPENMFSDCTAATTFSYCFCNCTSLTSAPSFEGLSKVTSFGNTFYGCTSLTSGPSFKGCSSVTRFDKTFYNCKNLVFAPTFEGCSKVTTFESVFSGFTALTTLPDKMFSGCTSATSFALVFYNCYSLKTVPVNIFDGTSAAVNFGSAFYGCSSVVGESPYTEFEIDGENMKIHLYERGDYYLEMRYSNPTSHSNCFTNSTFSDIESIPSSWGGNGN